MHKITDLIQYAKDKNKIKASYRQPWADEIVQVRKFANDTIKKNRELRMIAWFLSGLCVALSLIILFE